MTTDHFWPRGRHDGYTAFVIEVGIRKDQDGSCRSYKRLQSPEDMEAAQTLGSSQGMEEGFWGLLTEAVRTEAMLQIIVKLSNDPEFKEKLLVAEKAPEDLIEKLGTDTLDHIRRTLARMVPGLAREAVEQVRNELRYQSSE